MFLEFKRNFEQKTIDTTLKTTQHFFESVEDKSQEQDLSTPLLEYLAKQNDRQRVRVNQKDERRKKVFIKKQEKEEFRRIKKVEKEIFIKPKLISKSSTTSKSLIEEKPMKDSSQKKIIKSHHKDDTGYIDEKKKFSDENYKIKSEDTPRVDDVKKTEFKIKTSKLNNSNKCFENDSKDEISSKSDRIYIDDSKEDIEVRKKSETSKLEHSENKTSSLLKYNKSHENKESVDTGEMENYKKHRFDADKKYTYTKRMENRRQESKVDRRIRNKDRPAIEIYRPGMGRLSKVKAENDVGELESKK